MRDRATEVQRCIATNAVRELLKAQLGRMPTDSEMLVEYQRRANEAVDQLCGGPKPAAVAERMEVADSVESLSLRRVR